MLNTQLLICNMSDSQKLFDTGNLEQSDDFTQTGSKSVIDKLLKVRRSLSPDEQRFGLPKINLLIEELRSLTRATPNQREEMILYAVEHQGATTETEIAEDTRLHRSVVKELVKLLIEKDLLYVVPRTVIGSGRPQFAIKSKRLRIPEAD